jgi:hypothetical protein
LEIRNPNQLFKNKFYTDYKANRGKGMSFQFLTQMSARGWEGGITPDCGRNQGGIDNTDG